MTSCVIFVCVSSMEGEDMFYEERGNNQIRQLGANPFLQVRHLFVLLQVSKTKKKSAKSKLSPFDLAKIPDPLTAKEFKSGWLYRKCCVDSDGKKASFLKRSWKLFYASLRDMIIYMHKVGE